MKIIRYQTRTAQPHPFVQLAAVTGEVGRLLDPPFFGRFNRVAPVGWTPAFDLYENQDKLTVRAEVPGLKKDQIKLVLKDDVLTVSGERRPDADSESAKYVRRERAFGSFERTVTLPFPVNHSGIAAKFEDGVLTITLPKAEEAKPRQIAVN